MTYSGYFTRHKFTEILTMLIAALRRPLCLQEIDTLCVAWSDANFTPLHLRLISHFSIISTTNLDIFNS